MERKANINRKTKETDISLELNIDGKGESNISSGVGFLDHMLESFARHGLFDLDVKCEGDLIVDCHHTIEDIGIVLGQAIKKALGDKKQIVRFGSTIIPMDESLVLVSLDLSNRPYLTFDYKFDVERVGYFDTEMVKEFFYAISYSAGMNLHIKVLEGGNAHHVIEAIFKAFAKSLDYATLKDPRIIDVLSTKGDL
ncbi:MAG: imidazoleglycerol-phosphate dehydratase HisB [Lachnospiraceae bacterium]|nr:imidazoleglycerol-phosphate dehydratase HisB [Lachnospiraceae bacterium]